MKGLRIIGLLAFLMLASGICASAQVTVANSTGADGNYTTLKGAFDAINANATQTGNNINVTVTGNTTETATAELTAGNWTSLTVRPTVAATVTGSIVGAVIKLNGADNVTIDGRIGGTGTARSLTVSNSSTATATAAIWLASGTTAGSGATNNVIRNLELAGGTDTSVSGNSTFGVIMSGTTISVTANGIDNDNNQFIFNRIVKVRYGIVTRGTTTDLNVNPVVTDNIIGPAAFGTDQIGKTGILMQADTGAIVSRNIIQSVGCLETQTCTGADRVGIGIGSDSWGITDTTTLTSANYTVTRNIVRDVVDAKTFSSVGIKLGTTQGGAATGNLVANNFIYNIRSNGTLGDQVCGIGIAGGNGDRVVFNSISITGDMDPGAAAATTMFGNGIRIPGANGTNNANFVVQNNSIYMDASSNTATVHFYDITLNSAAYSFGTGGLNYNNYYYNPANAQLFTGGLASVTGAAATTEFQTLANWQAALTPPQDANSIQANPLYFSNTLDLHIQQASPNINAGTTIAGVTDDIDGQVRPNGAAPDIGADEFYPSSGTVQLASSTYSVSETGGIVTVTVLRLGGANGAATVDYATGGGTAVGGASCTAGVDYISTSGTLTWTDLDAAPKTFNITICADGVLEAIETFNVTLSNPTGVTISTPSAATISIFDGGTPFNGAVNVGTGEAVTSLTNPGGLFQAVNNGLVAGNVTINITSDLAGETGTIALNEIGGGFTVTIKPSGAARTISGTSSATAGLVGFNGADNVTIDGSLSGGTDRSLTIAPGNAAASGGGIYFASGANGARNNTVKNVNVFGGGSTTGVLLGIAFGGDAFGGVGADNDNNRIENNDVRGAFYGIASLGASAANKDAGLVITRNVLSGTGTAGIGRVGIYVIFADGAQITANNIASVSNPGAVDTIGIAAGSQALSNVPLTTGGISNAIISRNYVGVVSNNSAQSAAGILVASDATGTNRVDNNMITGVIGNSDTPDIVVGIYVNPLAGSTQNIYYNSVSMTGDRGTTANQFPSYALVISADQPVNVLNNILFNSQTRTGATGGGGESYAIGFDGPAANANLISNYNDLLVSGPLGQIGITGDLTTAAQTTVAGTGTNQTTLAAWQAATGEDANSVSIDPLWVSTTDLHLQASSPVQGLGLALADVMFDFDNQPRPAANTDIGADEYALPTAASVEVGGRVRQANGRGIFRARVTLTDSDGSVRMAFTNPMGFYRFGSVPAGGTYIFSVAHRRYRFAQPTQAQFINADTDDVNFTATGENPAFRPEATFFDRAPFDFDGDGRTDVSVFRSSENVWYIKRSSDGALLAQPFGAAGDRLVPADYDGDGRTDFAIFRSSEGNWYVWLSASNSLRVENFGAAADRPIAADFDGDGKADFSVWNETRGTWQVKTNAGGAIVAERFVNGKGIHHAVASDRDGDGKADFIFFNESNGVWKIRLSGSGENVETRFGQSGDRAAVGDFDGDGRGDLAIYRQGENALLVKFADGENETAESRFAVDADNPATGDFDGDGKTDAANFREGVWSIRQSVNGFVREQRFGLPTDTVIPAAFDR